VKGEGGWEWGGALILADTVPSVGGAAKNSVYYLLKSLTIRIGRRIIGLYSSYYSVLAVSSSTSEVEYKRTPRPYGDRWPRKRKISFNITASRT
jgi:hypothetical protein